MLFHLALIFSTLSYVFAEGNTAEAPCGRKKNGDYDLGCNYRYITCANTFAYLRECPLDVLRFDKVSGACHFPKDVDACNGTSPTTTTTTQEPTSTTDGIPVVSCDGVTESRLVAPPADQACSPYILWCIVGSPFSVAQICPFGTFGDYEFNRCEFKSNLPQCGGVRPTTAAPPTPTTSEQPTTTEKTVVIPVVDCTREPIAPIAPPSEYTCAPFILWCLGGATSVAQVCPSGTFGDYVRNACDFAENVDGCRVATTAEKTTPTTTTTPPLLATTTIKVVPAITSAALPETSATTTNEATLTTKQAKTMTTAQKEFTCVGRQAGNHADPRYRCSHAFYFCEADDVVGWQRRSCGQYDFYDDVTKGCLPFYKVASCQRPTTSTVEAPTTTAATTTATTTHVHRHRHRPLHVIIYHSPTEAP